MDLISGGVDANQRLYSPGNLKFEFVAIISPEVVHVPIDNTVGTSHCYAEVLD